MSATVLMPSAWAHGRAAPAVGHTARREVAVTTRPNILLMISDDQTWSTFDRQNMPNVYSQIADQGVLFNDAYVNSSLCCPSRASMFTGLYATDSGVSANVDPLTRPTVVQALHDSGYRTLLSGKYLNSTPCSSVQPEFDDWYCYGEDNAAQTNPLVDVNGVYRQYPGYAADVFANFVTHFIDTTPASQPFFAIYAPKVPHLPTDDHRFDGLPVPTYRPPSFDEDTQSDGKPAMFQRGPLTPREVSSIDSDYDGMYRTSRAVDVNAGTILDSLGPRAANTLVIYLSDNGFLYGEHRIAQGKEVAYQPSVNVPMAIRFPRDRPTDAPIVSDALVQNTDIAPTIAAAAGIAWKSDGVSLLPLVRGTRNSVRSEAVIERCVSSFGSACAPVGSSPYFFGIVTDPYKYVEYATGERELYDLQTDPWELHNLAGTPSFAKLQARLAARLALLRAPPPPVATMVTGPSGTITGDLPVTFTYFSPAIDATYQCRLDRAPHVGHWKPCGDQSTTLGPLPDGDYRFLVEGVNHDGTVGTDAATRSFTVASRDPTVSVADASVTEGDGDGAGAALTFVVSLSKPSLVPVVVDYETTDLTAASPDDFASASGTLRFAPRVTQQSIVVPVVGDDLHEIDETLRLSLSHVRNATLERATAIGTIVDDDAVPTVSIGGASAPEGATLQGGTLQFPVTLTPASGVAVTVDYATSGLSARPGRDYLTVVSTLTLPAGTTNATIPVALVGDDVNEGDRTLAVTLTDPTDATVGTAVATGTILDDDPLPSASIADTQVVEGDAGQTSTATFAVSLSAPSGQAVAIPWTTIAGSATSGADYTAAHGVVHVAIGATSAAVAVTVLGDDLVEGAETFTVQLGDPTNATLGRGAATATIIDNESPTTISVNDVDADVDGSHSGVARFDLTLPFPVGLPVTVDYQTVDGSATAPDDYTATEGTATFDPGETDAVVAVPVRDDLSDDPYRMFTLRLSNPTNAMLADAKAAATIVSESNLPVAKLQPGPSVTEGDARTVSAVFQLTLSDPSPRPVSLDYTTADGTASAGSDYEAQSGTVTIAPGATAASIIVPVIGDRIYEDDETFTLTVTNPIGARLGSDTATGTIVDDDSVPEVAVADDAVVTEGDDGTTPAVFSIVMSRVSAFPTTVTYATTDETAVSPLDYEATAGTVTIPPGALSTTVSVPVIGDRLYEGDEHFLFTAISTTNARINDDGYAAFGVITNDDAPPVASVADRAVVEGDHGTTTDRFVFSLSEASGLPVTVVYATHDGTATAGSDYIATFGQRTIPAGETEGRIPVKVIGDRIVEPDETFTVVLSDAIGATLGDATAIGTIVNDDSDARGGRVRYR